MAVDSDSSCTLCDKALVCGTILTVELFHGDGKSELYLFVSSSTLVVSVSGSP